MPPQISADLRLLIYPPRGHRLKETRTTEYKERFDIAAGRQVIEIAKDIAAMANTAGGRLVLGVSKNHVRVGLSEEQADAINPEDLDNKVGRYLDPRVECEYQPLHLKGRRFGVITVSKLDDAFCVMKRDGAYSDAAGKTKTVFRKGDVYVRHAAKSERANRADFLRMLREALREQKRFWLDGINKVVSAPAGSQLLLQPAQLSSVRVSTDQSALPVRSVLDTSKFEDVNQELTAAVKLWNTNRAALISEPQLYEMYARRYDLQLDEEKASVLLRSSLMRWAPSCYWASKLRPPSLASILTEEIDADRYPSVSESLTILVILGDQIALRLFGKAEQSRLVSVQDRATKHRRAISLPMRDRIRFLSHQGSSTITYDIGAVKRRNIDDILRNPATAKSLASEIALSIPSARPHYNSKSALRRLDIGLYGPLLQR